MSIKTIRTTVTFDEPAQHLLGLKALELHVDRETFIYILRSLYAIIFRASELQESKAQLKSRISRFERLSNLPGFMSAMPIDQLLTQLEDAQYYYPVRQRDIVLPTFK